MVEQLTYRFCAWCGRLATDYHKTDLNDKSILRYFCDKICEDNWTESRK